MLLGRAGLAEGSPEVVPGINPARAGCLGPGRRQSAVTWAFFPSSLPLPLPAGCL